MSSHFFSVKAGAKYRTCLLAFNAVRCDEPKKTCLLYQGIVNLVQYIKIYVLGEKSFRNDG